MRDLNRGGKFKMADEILQCHLLNAKYAKTRLRCVVFSYLDKYPEYHNDKSTIRTSFYAFAMQSGGHEL